MTVESEVGEGTTFSVLLPVMTPIEEPQPDTPPDIDHLDDLLTGSEAA